MTKKSKDYADGYAACQSDIASQGGAPIAWMYLLCGDIKIISHASFTELFMENGLINNEVNASPLFLNPS